MIILFVAPLDPVDLRMTNMSPIATEKHGHKASGHFGQKKASTFAAELKIEWEHLFRTFLK